MSPTILRIRKTLVILALFSLMAQFVLFAQSDIAPAGKRLALVVGNSAYQYNVLKNPVNDACDIAAALKAADFEVTLVTDADSARFDQAVDDFAKRLQGAEVGLFYYAGHGVKVDGVNFLIPVSPRIDDASTAKAKGMAVDTVVAKIEGSGVRTTLIFLDSCRNNPFPGASRSGTRGLAVVPSPKTRNSLIAYATSPGDTAQDGNGRNGVFSGAVLKYLHQPGLELGSLMKSVKADVAQSTANKQNPRVDDGMKEDFFFINLDQLAARSKAASDQAAKELADLDRQLAERQKIIASSNDSAQRQKLELDQQRQQALQSAKKLEAANLKTEADKQAKAAEDARQVALQKTVDDQAAQAKQSDLSILAAARRAELEKLAKDAASDSPDILIETVEYLEKVLAELDGQYAEALRKSQMASNATWDKQVKALDSQIPDITETDDEFAFRIKAEKSTLEKQRQTELARLKNEVETQAINHTASIRKQYNETLASLQTKVWTLTGSSLVLTPGSFDRNARTWTFTVTCNDPSMPILPQTMVADLSKAIDPKQAIKDTDTAIKANALVAEIGWGISRQADKARYRLDLRKVAVRNLTTNNLVVETVPKQGIAYFTPGRRNRPIAAVASLTVGVKTGSAEGEVWVNGTKVGKTPWSGKVPEGQVMVEVKWADTSFPVAQTVNLESGKNQKITVAQQAIKLGGTGQAGGFIFYDKGYYSDGWRYLEAAPADLGEGIEWYNGKNVDIATDTKVGTGKANTTAIIAAQDPGQYAATLCDSYILNGFDDWFLPSKDELNEIYIKLKKTNMRTFSNVGYWSSSQDGDNYAWYQYFGSGNQYSNFKGSGCRVRPVRAF